MYEGGVPENIISEKSGHRSIKGLRAHEKTSITQEKAAGATLNATVDPSAKQTTEDTKPRNQPGLSKHSVEDVKPHVQPGLPTFTGLQNCTFNFYNT